MTQEISAVGDKPPARLTNRQQAFVEEYLACWNATEAARRAGYSKKTANEQGSRLLANVSVKAAVAARLAELKADADEVLIRLTDHARGSIEDLMDDEARLSLTSARERGKLHLVRKLKQTTRWDGDGNKIVTDEVELHDAQAALVQLGRHHKLFVDRTEFTGKDGGVLKVEYVNDWRGPAADAAPGPALGTAERAPVQLAGGGTPLAEDDPGDGDRG
jgi:phage terminase small subunit